MTICQRIAVVFFFPLMASIHVRCSSPAEPPEETKQQDSITQLLPQSGELENWNELFSPQHVIGEDLYSLINGGAEIYHEYGFRQAVNHSYESAGGRSINVEIYEMESPESAFGIYSFKTGEEGKPVSIGNDGLLESYYLNFWKGNYLVTLVGFDTEPETVESILQMARLIDAKMEEGASQKPEIVRYLPTEGLNPFSVVYLKGIMALRNNYEFDSGNIFGMEEGVIGEYGDSRILVFKYEDEVTAFQWFQRGLHRLSQRTDLVGFTVGEDEFSATDGDGLTLYGRPFRNTIVLVVGGTPDDARRVVEAVSKEITPQTQ